MTLFKGRNSIVTSLTLSMTAFAAGCTSLSSAAELTWSVSHASAQCSISEPGVQLFDYKRGQQYLNQLQKKQQQRVIGKPKMKHHVAQEQAVLAINMGQRSSGGYGVVVQKAALSENTLNVHVKWVTPGPDSFTSSALTSPCTVVTIDHPISKEESDSIRIKVYDQNNNLVLQS